jgi:hypothetical protein
MFVTFLVNSATAQIIESYPQPASEYAEKTGPGTMTFLSYPKYYRDESNVLRLTDTTFQVSNNPNWDFEVTTGIWSLHVRADGTFRASHAGDQFTYRFADLGVGRGSTFHSLALGSTKWDDYVVVGDTIRWKNVLPGVDVSVRYVHDVLKVDVVIANDLVQQIRSSVRNNRLPADDFLTARFDIPHLMLRNEARQNGANRDLYAESFSIDHPLEFIKDDKVVERLRQVECYVTAENGNRLQSSADSAIRSSQLWQLKENGAGIAEISAVLGDIADAPIGDLVIDPSMEFAPSSRDTCLNSTDSTSWWGCAQALCLNNQYRALFGFNINALPADIAIKQAKLKLYVYANNYSSSCTACAYKVKSYWTEAANYQMRTSTENWGTPGGDYELNDYRSPYISISSSSNQWVEFDVSRAFESHMYTNRWHVSERGFLVRLLTEDDDGMNVYSREYTGDTSLRPKLTVEYITSFDDSADHIVIADISLPYPEGPANPVKFGNQWYVYINSKFTYAPVRPSTFVSLVNDGNGLATSNVDNIANYLLREANPVPTPAATGTPHPVFQSAGNQFTPIPTNTPNWYGRMAAICSNYLEVGMTPTPTRVHYFFHAEDTQDEYGNIYGLDGNGLHRSYDRCGYARSDVGDPLSIYQVDASSSIPSNPGPLIECFMSELKWQYPYGTPTTPTPNPDFSDLEHGMGARHPWIFKKGSDLYLFYDRNLTDRYTNPRLTPIPTHTDCENLKKSLFLDGNGNYFFKQSICVAKTSESSFLSYNPNNYDANPWIKFFNGSFDVNQNGNGGWSSPVVQPYEAANPAREAPSVTKNLYLSDQYNDVYTMLCRGVVYPDTSIFLHLNNDDTLTDWSCGMRIDLSDYVAGFDDTKVLYPYFINNDSSRGTKGSAVECGQDAHLYFQHSVSGASGGMYRIQVQFSQ